MGLVETFTAKAFLSMAKDTLVLILKEKGEAQKVLVESLKSQIDSAESKVDLVDRKYNDLEKEAAALRAENARLAELVAKAGLDDVYEHHEWYVTRKGSEMKLCPGCHAPLSQQKNAWVCSNKKACGYKHDPPYDSPPIVVSSPDPYPGPFGPGGYGGFDRGDEYGW